MKESIGGTQIFLIVIALVIIFSGIMAFTINHSNAFSVKDQLVTVLENNGGMASGTELVNREYEYLLNDSQKTLLEMVEILEYNSYRATGRCPESEGSNYVVTAYDRDGRTTVGSERSSFCIAKVKSAGVASGTNQTYYYQVIVFYSLDIPILNELMNFKAVGETKPLYK